MQTITAQCEIAYKNRQHFSSLDHFTIDSLLEKIAKDLASYKQDILKANEKDMIKAKQAGMSPSLQDRLFLDSQRLDLMCESLLTIKSLKSPIGKELDRIVRPNGIEIVKTSVALGVIGIIYEARPNVTIDAIALCIKTGNSVVLRGSSSAYESNHAICKVVKRSIEQAGVCAEGIQLLENTSRESIAEFVKLKRYLDLVIPRGGSGLINYVVENACVACIETGVGNCHIYVDRDADFDKAINIIINAKTQRPSVCNACETVLIDKAVPDMFKKRLIEQLLAKKVRIKGCEQSLLLSEKVEAASDDDWLCEYLDLTIALKFVENVHEAITHIDCYGSRHTEAIVSENKEHIELFSNKVDAACVTVNASTRFTDGAEFGFGAEMGISTQKLHVRGPMGLDALCSYKYILSGSGHCRE